MTKFAEGDVVRRKMGGPLMTVEGMRQCEFISVVWFDKDDHVQRDVFHPTTLEKWVRAED